MTVQRIKVAARRGMRGLPLTLAIGVTVALAGASAQAAESSAHAIGPIATGPVTSAGPVGSAAGTISTVAGGVGGPAKATAVALGAFNGGEPCGVTFASGHLYVGDQVVREVNPDGGRLTTPAGANIGPFTAGLTGNGVPAADALVMACYASVDRPGNLVIANHFNSEVQVVAVRTGNFYGRPMSKGDVYTVAGNDAAGDGGSGVPATRTPLHNPVNAAVDAHGNLVIADSGNPLHHGRGGLGSRVRVVAASSGTFYGEAMTAGDIYTIAGTDKGFRFSGDGGPATAAALGVSMGEVAIDGAGNLVIADSFNQRVRVVAESSGTFYGQAMTAGDIYTVAGDGTFGFSGDGGPATAAELAAPGSVTVDGSGNVVINDAGNARVRVAAASSGTFYGRSMTAGDVYTVAGDGTIGFSGDGGPATAAELDRANGVAVDADGNLAISESAGRVRVVAASSGTFYGEAMTAGDIYTAAGNGRALFSGDGGPATAAELFGPAYVAVDAAGNLAITEFHSNRVRVLAGSTGMLYGRPVIAGHVYTVAGDGKVGFSGDGGPATAARVNAPFGAAIDSAGNLVICDFFNARVRVVAGASGMFYGRSMTAGDIYTVAGDGTAGFSGDGGPATAAELQDPADAAVDSAGNLVISDSANARVRVVAGSSGMFYGRSMTAGDIYTVAGDGTAGFSGDGGPAVAAELDDPAGVTVDRAGNLVISDSGNQRVRVVAAASGTFYRRSMIAGHIYTVAGDGVNGFSGDGGPAASAELSGPDGVAVDSAGNLVIADAGNGRVRVVAAASGTFYGQAITAGDIGTVAGNGNYGFFGDGGPASSAEFTTVDSVAVNPAGNLLVADLDNNRVRMVSG